jgi:tRNA threonylcarbamoyladenosine biosynthesis protein TsaB
MNILALDTSTSLASLALVCNEKVVAAMLFPADRCLSARLIPEIERLLGLAGLSSDSIDLFAGAIGPGSFTGVRAGIATLQGLALATGKPCAGFSTLEALAMNFPRTGYPVCAMLDARKNEVYAALYDSSSTLPRALIEECVMLPEPFLDRLSLTTAEPVIFAGDGALRYREIIAARMGGRAIFAGFPQQAGQSANGALLALEQFRNGQALAPARLLPVYIRPSEAEYAKIGQQGPRKTA